MGNGKNMNLYTDAWNDNRPSIPTALNLHVNKVADLINENGTWKHNLIWNSFTFEDARKIMATHIPKKGMKIALIGNLPPQVTTH